MKNKVDDISGEQVNDVFRLSLFQVREFALSGYCRPPGRLGMFLVIVAIVVSAVAATPLSAQTYPSKPVRMLVPSSPGGGTDITARILAPKMSESLRQQFVVENRPGANTMIGTEVASRAAPDGYTLLLVSTPLSINPAMHKKIPYDAIRDFSAITQVVSLPNLLVSNPSLPVRTVKELVVFAKARPDQLSYASAGAGSSPHLAMALLAHMSGLKMVHVPYKGAGPGIIDVVSGQVVLMTPSIISAINFVKNGRLRALGVTGLRRASGAPNIPTVAESGIPGYEAAQWFGLMVPVGVSPEIINMLRTEVVRVLQLPDVRERFSGNGAEPVGNTPEEFLSYIRSETAKWSVVARNAGIKAE